MSEMIIHVRGVVAPFCRSPHWQYHPFSKEVVTCKDCLRLVEYPNARPIHFHTVDNVPKTAAEIDYEKLINELRALPTLVNPKPWREWTPGDLRRLRTVLLELVDCT